MGIGYQGKTLKQILEERDRLSADTGYYYGLKTLPLTEEDPIKMNRFHARLTAAVVNARETAKYMAGSPTLRSFGECLWMLGTPEGDILTASMGLAGHIGCAPWMIRYVIERGFEDSGEITDGSIWFTNDGRMGSGHPADCYNFVPIFYEGEVVAWAVGMNHVLELGGTLPGNLQAYCPTLFTDGVVVSPTRVGENFKIAKWWDDMWMYRTRSGPINVLDDKARTTGVIMTRDKVLDVIKDFGIDYFRQAIKEIIERERRNIERHVATELVPGIYTTSVTTAFYQKGTFPMVPESNIDLISHNIVELHVTPDKRFVVDCEGTSSEEPTAFNSWSGGVWIGLAWWFIPLILRDTAGLNTAMMYQLKTIIPSGCNCNPKNLMAGQSMGGTATGSRIASIMNTLYSKIRYMRGVIEEAAGIVNGTHIGITMGGYFDNDVLWAGFDFSFAGFQNVGARPFMDGVPFAACPHNPESDSQEVEEWALYDPPAKTLAKGGLTNMCGHGKYRGALNSYCLETFYHTGKLTQFLAIMAIGNRNPTTTCGVSGSYPGIYGFAVELHDTNLMELMKQGQGYPTTLEEIWQWVDQGKLKVGSVYASKGQVAPFVAREGDLILVAGEGSNGFGDPLERDPALVISDLNIGDITSDAAKGIYGVVANQIDRQWKVDDAATAAARKEIRKQRLERGIPFKQWWQQERENVKAKGFTPMVYDFNKDLLKWNKTRSKFINMWQVGKDYQL